MIVLEADSIHVIVILFHINDNQVYCLSMKQILIDTRVQPYKYYIINYII